METANGTFNHLNKGKKNGELNSPFLICFLNFIKIPYFVMKASKTSPVSMLS